MSLYCKYDETCKTYDYARTPMDSAGLRKALQATADGLKKELKDLRVLDAGCGTGNYLAELADLPCQFTGFDGSTGMIETAKSKLSNHQHISLSQGNLTNLQFSDSSFDFIMTTQVLHHLQSANKDDETKEPTDWTVLTKVLSEFGRVLCPGGVYWCQTSTPQQQIDGFWWGQVVPQAVKVVGVKFPTIERLTDTLKSVGFCQFDSYIPPDPLMRKDLYLNIKGPFDVAFRNCDSSWCAVSEEEMKSCHDKLSQIISGGRTEQFFEEREALRAKIGQTTTFIAKKGAVAVHTEAKSAVIARG